MKIHFSILLLALAGLVPSVSAQNYAYDDAGRLTKVVYSNGKAVIYTYDLRDNLVRVAPAIVPPVVTRLSIRAVPVSMAELSWEHLSGAGAGFLIQTSIAGSDAWIDGPTVDIGARSAIVSNTAREDLFYRIVVLGTTEGLHSAPSAEVRFPSGIPLLVTTATDENDHQLGVGNGDSLREVIEAASPGDLIHFAPELSGRRILLNGSQLTIEKNLTIDASPLPDRIIIDAGSASRVFRISAAGAVILNGLTMSGGSSGLGGGIFNDNVALRLRRCTLTNNVSVEKGGAVYNVNGGQLTVDGGHFSSNTSAEGGAIFNATGSSLEISGALFTGNTAVAGGAMYNQSDSWSIKFSSFSANGGDEGGAIYNLDGTGLVENTTFSGNAAALNLGGGIANHGRGNLIIRHCTIAEHVGGGILNRVPAVLALDNSIVASNFAVDNTSLDLSGDYTAIGANLVREHEGTLLSGPAPIREDPALGALKSGAMSPLVGSPVIDAGVVTADTPSSDQFRAFRPNGPAPDLGSVESRLSADVDLEWLTTSAGQYSPPFEASTTAYAVTVSHAVMTAAVRAAKVRGGQTIEVGINGGALTEVGNRAASPELPLDPGENTIEVKVTAQNGTATRTYTILVTRGAPDAANVQLAGLSVSAGALSPAFDAAVTSYHTFVPNGTAEMTVTAPTVQAGTTVEMRANFGDYLPVAPGEPSPPFRLHPGANSIDIRVISEDGKSTTLYTLTVTREDPSPSNARLSELSLSIPGGFSPAFAPGISNYATTVDGSVSSASITAVPLRPASIIRARFNGGDPSTLAAGVASSPWDLLPGANVIEVIVTSPDGGSESAYSIVVTRVGTSVEWVSGPADGMSENAVISADCRFVAFSSRSSNLVANDTNSQEDVFVRDLSTGVVERVSLSSNGEEGDFESTNPSISADGRYVAFQSESTNLVPDDRNGQVSRSAGEDVFVYDRTTKTIERISLTENGGEANQKSQAPSISGDGRFVAFSSGANNLISGFRNGEVNVYVRDRQENTIVGVLVPFSDLSANRVSLNPVISADGNYVAFEFHTSKNDGNRSFQYRDIYLFNRLTRGVERITGSKVGLEADGTESESAAISADGRYVAFQSDREDLDFYDTNGRVDVFVYDRVDGSTRRVSASFDGIEQRFQDSVNPSISGNGRYVAFDSNITNFVAQDGNEKRDVFVRDLMTGEMALRPVGSSGVQGNGDSSFAALSFDGRCVAFQSRATNLGGDHDGIYVASTNALAPSSLADLAGITSNLGALSPGFSPSVTGYSVSVSQGLQTARLRPVASDAGATIEGRVNGGSLVPLPSDGDFALPLGAGDNTLELVVTAADGGTEKTYAFELTRFEPAPVLSDNASLSGLVPSAGAFSPAFSGDTLVYSMVLPNTIASMTLTPAVAHPGATVTVNDAAVATGSASGLISLSAGSNTIFTKVTAEDGVSTRTYVLAVTRELSAMDTNAELATLVPSVGALSPAFDSAVTIYSIGVSHETESITVTPVTSDSEASVIVNGQTVSSGAASGAVRLGVGPNIIVAQVTARDGVTTRVYVVTVTRESDGNAASADLTELVPSTGALTPAFSSNTLSFVMSVPRLTGSIRLTPTVADSQATVVVNGQAVPSGTASEPISLAIGSNFIVIQVTARDGVMTKVYAVTVTREEAGGGGEPLPDLLKVSRSDDGVIMITLPEGKTGDLEYSTDLTGWTVIATGVTGIYEEKDAARRAAAEGYYRMK